MKKIKTLSIILIFGLIAILISESNIFAGKSGCEAYIYAINNSAFDINSLSIDGVDMGSLVMGKFKTYKVELLNDQPKKFKVKIVYENNNYLEPRSFNVITKKIECAGIDSIFFAHTQ